MITLIKSVFQKSKVPFILLFLAVLFLSGFFALKGNRQEVQASVMGTPWYLPLVMQKWSTPVPPTAMLTRVPSATLTATATKTATRNPSTQYTDIIFLHHSVGMNLINEGNMRQLFTQKGYSFYDHDYNQAGVRLPNGQAAGYNYNIPHNSTDLPLTQHPNGSTKNIIPNGYYDLFGQNVYTSGVSPLPGACNVSGHPDDQAMTCLMRHQVIVFKSCYTNSDIDSTQRIEEYKTVYRRIVAFADQHPNHIFITLGFAPQQRDDNPTPGSPARAAEFINWLNTSSEMSNANHPNFYIYDLHTALAGPDGFLKDNYTQWNGNSHPNQLANQTIGPLIVDFVDQAITDYKSN